ncbi:MAG: FG-GAP-like repeat-containing protein [Cyclobacteriaceae bacterium]
MRRLISFVFFTALAVPFLSYSQTLFTPKTTLLTKSNQRDFVLAADFDNDGDQDVLTFEPAPVPDDCCGGGTYYLVYNDGAGNFTDEARIYTDEVVWENIRTGDLDGDGLEDIIIYRFEDQEVRWLRNNGPQEFTLKSALLTDYTGGSFEIADLTGDGLDDIVYADTEAQLFLLENEGSETFLETGPIATGKLLHIADFDADERPDLFTLTDTQEGVIWHRNNGDDTFTPNTTSIENEIPFSTPSLLVADFSGDGSNELIISYAIAGDDGIVAPKLYQYNESEEFVLQTSLSDPEVFELSPSNIMAEDIDQDGDLDVLAGFQYALAFSRIQSDFDKFAGWYENTGNLQFTPRLLENALLEGVYVDLNNDQRKDALFDVPGGLIWQENLGQATFAAARYLTNNRSLSASFSDEEKSNISFGDLNQDGLPEVIVSEGISNKVQYFANENGVLATTPALLTLNTLKPTDAAVLEASGDQLNDLVVVGGDAVEGLGIYLYPNQGGFLLGEKDTLYARVSDAELIVGDFNGDTYLDIAFSDRDQSVDGEIIMLSNQANQTFAVVETQIVGTIKAAFDMNGDAQTDMVTEDGIYTQTSEGSFELIRALDFTFTDIEDINGDGLFDFLSFSAAEVTLYLANEDGSYQEQTLTFGEDYDFTMIPWVLLDVDNDQDKDLVFIRDTGTNRELAYLLNINSTTAFGEYTVIDSFDDTNFRLFSHDIDQDTDTDLVVLTDTELAWYQSSAYEEEGEIPENSAPTVANPIEDQQAAVNEEFSLTIGEDVFADADEGDTLTLSVALSDSTELPDWLTFDTSSNTLSGTPPKAGVSLTIRVTATDTAMASVSDEFTLTVDTGENPITSLEEDIVREVWVYPVPTSSMLFLESEQPGASLQSYQLTDIQGKVLKQRALSQNGTNSIRIDVSSLVKGIYLLEIQTPEKTYQQRILIE